MGDRQAKTAGAVFVGAVALVVAVGWSAGDTAAPTARSSTAASTGATPAPSPGPGGAVPVQPVGGGGCIIGLNCGCVHSCHTPHHRPPDSAGDPQRAAPAPAPQNP